MLFVGKGSNRRNFLVCKPDGEATFSGQVGARNITVAGGGEL
jgi:hypothetical protein